MSAENRYTGKDLYITFDGTVVSLDYTSFEVSAEQDFVDASAGSETAKSKKTTLHDATMKLTVFATGTAGSAAEAKLVVGQSGSLVWGPQGTATGKPKYSCTAFVKSNGKKHPFDDMVKLDVAFERNGDWAEHYEKLGSTW